MENFDYRDLYDALGLYQPWIIESVRKSSTAREFHIHLSRKDEKQNFHFFSAQNETAGELQKGSWRYMNIGEYSTVIHAEVPVKSAMHYNGLNELVVSLPAFVGPIDRPYSGYVRQKVALACAQEMDASLITRILNIDVKSANLMLDDLHKASARSRILACLPVDTDPVWMQILLDKKLIKTSSLPLKYLLSKLKLIATRSGDSLYSLAEELRNFFICHCVGLEDEIDQLCGINTSLARRLAAESKGNQRFILPSATHPVWSDVLSGQLNLHSSNVSLNLFLAQQREAYSNLRSREDKLKVVELLRDFLRQKSKNLRAELICLNNALNTRHGEQALPGPEHRVWRNMLRSENYIPSQNMAFNLLLRQLRMQQNSDHSESSMMEAAQKIRQFMTLNQRVMRDELGRLLEKCSSRANTAVSPS